MDILNHIGNTPLIRIKREKGKANIFAKLELFNPTGSVKDRPALAMVLKAERKRILKKGKTILEPTSGNTGISLAMVGAVKGYEVKIVLPESTAILKRKMIEKFGAEIISVKDKDWRKNAIELAKKLAKNDKNLVLLNQFENKANVEIHYETTGREILRQMKGKKIDILVAGIGTGGTIVGIGKRLKKKYPNLKIIGVQPKLGSLIEGLKSLKEGYKPPILNLKIIDKIVEVEEKEALMWQERLAKEEGILAGLSSGAAFSVAFKESQNLKKGNIVVIFPDRGEKYLI
jgi:cysteine synthase